MEMHTLFLQLPWCTAFTLSVCLSSQYLIPQHILLLWLPTHPAPAVLPATSNRSPKPTPHRMARSMQAVSLYPTDFPVCRLPVWLQCVTLHQVLWLHWVLHFRPDGVRLVQPTLRPQPAASPLSVQQQFGPRGAEVVAGEDKEMVLSLKISLGWGRWRHLITGINLN